jgi:hypothetical protein
LGISAPRSQKARGPGDRRGSPERQGLPAPGRGRRCARQDPGLNKALNDADYRFQVAIAMEAVRMAYGPMTDGSADVDSYRRRMRGSMMARGERAEAKLIREEQILVKVSNESALRSLGSRIPA